MSGASVRLKNHSVDINRKLEALLQKRMALVGEVVASEVRKNISTSTRANGPSAPGEMPHADTGTLRKSVGYQVEVTGTGVTAIVGTPVEYSLFLEEGTDRMSARPFLTPTAKAMNDKVVAIIGAPIPPGGA